MTLKKSNKPAATYNKIVAEKRIKELFLQFENLLSSILKDKTQLDIIAHKSYNHLNGFSKIVLKDDKENDVRIRLHIWNDKPEKNDTEMGDVHDHRWSYVSIPLFGELKETRYKEKSLKDSSTDTVTKIRYKCFSRGETEWLNLEGYKKVALKKTEVNSRKKGEAYFCKAGEIHTIQPTQYPTASLVMTFNPKRTFARVYRNKIETEDFMKIYAPSLNNDDVKKAFSFVMGNRI